MERPALKVLLTGASGFVGAHVAAQLAKCAGVEVLLAARHGADLGRLHARGLLGRKGHMHLVTVDLDDRQAARELLSHVRPKVMLHLASPEAASDERCPESFHQQNRQTALWLLDAFIATGGSRFVAAGSCLEYGEQGGEPLTESLPPRPICREGAVHAQTTQDVLDACSAGHVEGLVLRLFAPYGPLQPAASPLGRLLAAHLSGQYAAGAAAQEQVCDYTYVEDVARAFVVAALRPRLPHKQVVYNVCTGQGHSPGQVAAHIAELLDCDPRQTAPSGAGTPWRLVGSAQKIRADLGWQAICTLPEGLKRTLAWMQPAAFAA